MSLGPTEVTAAFNAQSSESRFLSLDDGMGMAEISMLLWGAGVFAFLGETPRYWIGERSKGRWSTKGEV